MADSGRWIWEWGMDGEAVQTDRQTDQVVLRRPVILHLWVCLFTLQVLAAFSTSGTMFWLEGESRKQGSRSP